MHKSPVIGPSIAVVSPDVDSEFELEAPLDSEAVFELFASSSVHFGGRSSESGIGSVPSGNGYFSRSCDFKSNDHDRKVPSVLCCASALELESFVTIYHGPFRMLLVSLATRVNLLGSQLLQTFMKFSSRPIKSATRLIEPLCKF
jgi:hypothetical protein